MKCNPKRRFWLKADGTDVKAALQESVRREWNGDVDLLDGKPQDIQREYEARISSCETISKANDITTEDLVTAFTGLIAALKTSHFWMMMSRKQWSLFVQYSTTPAPQLRL